MHLTTRPVVLVVAALVLAGCGQARVSMLGPTPLNVGANVTLGETTEPISGALEQGETHSAGQQSGFLCLIRGFGTTTDSHATISNSGVETLVCRGETTLTPPFADVSEGEPCRLFFSGDITFNSHLVITPSGQVVLTCSSK